MPRLDEHAALVVLLRSGTRPWQAYAELIERAGSTVAALEAERVPPEGRLFPAREDAGLVELHTSLARASAEVASWRARGIQLVSVLDDDYPPNLRAVHDRPPLVFVGGQLVRGDARAVAVVGTRKASRNGLGGARAIAAHLVERGYTVVSGLATGIDSAAHTAALAAGGRTVAVIGTGLKRSYPPQNAELQQRIAQECAVVSQFWPDAPPSRRSFPMRNAVMSGIALATVVVEASHSSGSRIQARLALEHGRPVFLLEALLAEDWARELARRPGTHVFSSPEQITTTVERLSSANALVA